MKWSAVLGLLALAVVAAAGEFSPRIAVWDPVTSARDPRIHLEPRQLDQVAAWLREGGCLVDRLTAAQLDDPQLFSAATHDALFLPGDAFPLRNLAAYRRFASHGGVLVSLGAKLPFLVAIATGADGTWELQPREPKFAWQNPALQQLFGVTYRYDPRRHDLGVEHTVTPLFEAYLPQVATLRGAYRGWWLVPAEGGAIYPLLRSRRLDGLDTTPQIFLARRGPHRAIFCLNEWYTDASRPDLWPHSRATVIAFAQLAADLRHDRRPLPAADRLDVSEKIPPPEPLRNRLAERHVAPEGATAVITWGKFNGNSLDLGALVGPGEAVAWTAGQTCPRGLAGGARLLLPLPALPPGPCYLRVRGAYHATDSGLAVRRGETVLWRERFNYLAPGGQGEDDGSEVGQAAAEFTRLVYLPPGAAELALENPGREPVYFDALQVEQPAAGGVAMVLGLDPADLGAPADLPAGWLPFRPDAARGPTWDLAYGLHEGSLYAQGKAAPVYCYQAGFVRAPEEWFDPPPACTPREQRDLLNIALARLLASGVAKVALFHAAGSYPADRVLADYRLLGAGQAVRQDLAMAPAGPVPLQGVHAAAARHADGRVTIVVNPAELPRYQPALELRNPTQEFGDDQAPGQVFRGTRALAGSRLVLVPGPGQAYVGYALPIDVDLERWPQMELDLPACAGLWQLLLVGERTHTLADRQRAGRWSIDLSQALGPLAPFQGTLVLRCTGVTSVEFIRFQPPFQGLAPRAGPRVVEPLPVVLRLPLPGIEPLQARASGELDTPDPLPLVLHGAGAERWGELRLPLTSRTVIRVTP